jgi:crossover junction endodeoxyribonuclease RusA
MIVRLELPLAPSTNRLWKIGKGGRMYKSPEYTAWLEEAGWMIKAQTKHQITGPYIIHITATKPDKRRRDLDNLLKSTSDLLVKNKIVEDDSECKAIAAEWSDHGTPMIVTIYGLEEDAEAWNASRRLLMN